MSVTKINLPEKAHIRVDWKGYPEERTVETVNRVKTYFSEKYSGYVSNSRLSRINPDQDGSPEKFFNGTLGLYTDSIVFGSVFLYL